MIIPWMLRGNVCTNITDAVVRGVVVAVGVPGLSNTGSRVHLLQLLIQQGLKNNNVIHMSYDIKKRAIQESNAVS